MSDFLGDDYLLNTAPAKAIFREIRNLPILDPHNHADVKEIAENRNYANLWQIEGATDHYVWEMLRKRGVAEQFLTGPATPHEKWLVLAGVFEELVGSPTYEWIHLDLQRLLGIEKPINAENAEAIWQESLAILAGEDLRPQQLLRRMGVECMCSTDDPADSLEHHRALAASPIAGVVRPTFRPDKAMNIFKPDWPDYVARLEGVVGGSFAHVQDLVAGLRLRHDFFAANGCVASDHGVEVPYGYHSSAAAADAAFRKARQRQPLEPAEKIAYMSYILHEVAELDSAKGWVFQLHMGCVRDVRDSLARQIGPDSGGDISSHSVPIVEPLRDFLNRFDGRLKTVLYCLDPAHYATLASLARAFGPKVNLGPAWWLNDSPYGMRQHLEYISGVDVLSNVPGMVSDSRKLLSYASRHEMFRRCLSDVLGKMVAEGRAPLAAAVKTARRVTYDNPKNFYGI